MNAKRRDQATPTSLAVAASHESIEELLLEHGAEEEEEEGFRYLDGNARSAEKNGYYDIMEYED